MDGKSLLRPFFILLLYISLTGCGQPGSCVLLEMPELPHGLSCSWLIEYPSSGDAGIPVYTQKLTDGDTLIYPARGSNLPILVKPVFSLSESLILTGGFPAGAVYPRDVSGGVIKADWEAGFACEILRCCLLNSDAVSAFDTAAFRKAVADRSAEITTGSGPALPGGSWLLDPEPVICRLGYGLFRSSSLKAADTMSFDIQAAAGTWFPDNPLYPPVDVPAQDTGSGVLSVIVPVNRKTIFMQPETGGLIEVYFSEERWCWSNLLSGASGSGMM